MMVFVEKVFWLVCDYGEKNHRGTEDAEFSRREKAAE